MEREGSGEDQSDVTTKEKGKTELPMRGSARPRDGLTAEAAEHTGVCQDPRGSDARGGRRGGDWPQVQSPRTSRTVASQAR